MLLGNMEIRIQLFVAIYDAAWGNALLVDIFNRMCKRFILNIIVANSVVSGLVLLEKIENKNVVLCKQIFLN